MRWRHKDSARLAMLLDSSGNIHALFIDRNRNKTTACGVEHGSLEDVAGVLNPNGIVRIEKDACREIQGLLGTGNNHDLIWLALDRARGAEITADRFAETLQAKRLDVTEGVGIGVLAVLIHESCPNLEREQL